jgi:hypothetical protein
MAARRGIKEKKSGRVERMRQRERATVSRENRYLIM